MLDMVRVKVFIGSPTSEISDKAVYAVAVFNVRPVMLAEMTNTVKVTSGERTMVLLAGRVRILFSGGYSYSYQELLGHKEIV
jgi:hypothetical protein